MEAAGNNAATARLRADEAYIKAEQAQATASQALRTADEEKVRASRMTNKASGK
ncbi:alanine-zipper protein [Pseudomonas sp. LjRoot277]|uniref:alanine-zipper protein n=1 Tax=Pseudomonas sp. LjRoot277 TaxID=3342307 RepID=UPI003F4F9E08